MASETETYVREVYRQPTRELRRQALERVPYNKRARVEAEVRAKFEQRKKRR